MIFRTCLTLSLAATLMPPCAQAAQPETSERIVHYDDLDLSTPGGTRLLRHRIAAALEAVCGSYAGTQAAGSEREAEEIAQCRRIAQAGVEQRLAVIMSNRFRVSSAP